MKCPHCGGEFSRSVSASPKKLSKTLQTILHFCHTAKRSDQVADFIGLERNSVYKHLRLLQRLDVLEKVQCPNGGSAWHFIATGRPIAWDKEYMSVKPELGTIMPISVMGVRL